MVTLKKSTLTPLVSIVSLIAIGLFILMAFTGEAIGDQINWTEEYTCDVLPQQAALPWNAYIKYSPEDHLETVDDGILTIFRDDGYVCFARHNVLVLHGATTIEFRMRVVHNTVGIEQRVPAVYFGAGSILVRIWIYPDKVVVVRQYPSALQSIYMDTTDDFHIYRFLVENGNLKLYIDNIWKMTLSNGEFWRNLVGPWGGTAGTLVFGEYGIEQNPEGSSESQWDFIRFYNGAAIPPELNTPPVANAGSVQTVEGTSPAGAVVTLDGSGSTDPDSTSGTNNNIEFFDWYEGATLLGSGETIDYIFPLGSHTVTLVVTDFLGETDSDEVIIVVEDTTPPTIHSVSASPDVLWPPNHKMVEVVVEVDAEDICDPEPFCWILRVSSNEPINGPGDGDTKPDWEYTDDPLVVLLRAERAGGGNGRIYTIHVVCEDAEDASGNFTTADVDVTVPHDQGKGKKGKK